MLHLVLPEPVPVAPASARDDAGPDRADINVAPGNASPLPEPRSWAASFIQAAMEVTSGLRPPAQLVRWTTPEVHGTIVRRGTLAARALRSNNGMSAKPQLRALRLCAPRSGVYEVSAVISDPERVRAVAFRMEALHGRWRVTELEMQGRAEN
ncbi:Rv3235 family protein [Kineosporia succinea]|nr:Rv3235 family protein [Kineosporia succinea]